LFIIVSGHSEPQWINLPQLRANRGWHRPIETSLPSGEDSLEPGQEIYVDPADHYLVNPRSTVVLFAQPPKVVNAARPAQPTAAAAVAA